MDYDFDQLFALRTYYEEQNGYINDEIDIIKLIKTELVDSGMSNADANKLLQEFYKSFGITLKADELEHIRSIEEIGNQFINSLMHGFNITNQNNIPTSNNQTIDYIIQRNLNDSNIKKCNNPNCKKNKQSKIAEPKNLETSKNDDLIEENDNSSEENDEQCSCEYNDYENNDYENNDEEYDNNDEYNNTNYQNVQFGLNSLINNPSFSNTPFNSSNVFSNLAMNLMSELLIHNQPTEDIVCTLDEKDKENLKKIKLENDLEDKCNICMDQMKKEEDIIILPCNHIFHTGCIEEWLTKYNYKCPICKQEVGKPKYNI